MFKGCNFPLKSKCSSLYFEFMASGPLLPSPIGALERIKRVFPNKGRDSSLVRLVPKTSPRFNEDSSRTTLSYSEAIELSDFVLGFGGIENQILAKFDTPCKCMMLLKYMISNHEDLPLWSYYLKTLVVQMVIDKPDKDFWSNQNLFRAFKACLERLHQAVVLTDLHDTFDHRLNLLQLITSSGR